MILYKTVFLADDDAEDREIFQDALKAIDPSIQFYSATDGDKAIKLLESDFFERPDVIFLDLNMPLMNGLQVLAKLKSSLELRPIPVVMYSTNFNERDIEELQQLGAAKHVIKATAYQSLINTLTSVLTSKF